MELMEHQKQAVEQLSNGKILYGGVGSGKSLAVLAYYMANEQPKDIYVITTAKKRDSLEWEKDAAQFGIGTSRLTTLAGKITIDSWNNIGNYTAIEDAFFIFDEQRVVGSGAWVKAFIKIARKNRWLLLSATPGDTWLDYIPVFVANNLYKNPSEFKREHVVYAPFTRYPKIVRYMGVSTLEKYRNLILVEMPYDKHTIPIEVELKCEYDHEMYKKAVKDRWNSILNEPIRDMAELFRTMRKITNSHPSRLQQIQKLLSQHPRLVVYYNFDYELEILRGLSAISTVAEWNGHKHESIPQTDRWVYLVQYTAGAEGWNCTETNAMAFYSLTYSYKNFHQAKGRIDRLDTQFVELYYYILLSEASIDAAVRSALKNKKMFNERDWAIKNLESKY